MCTILLAWRAFDDTDYVLAANRDELVDRPAEPPQLLNSDPQIFGGRDVLAGGTWLAVSPDGRVCAVTNRRVGEDGEVTRDPSRRSRGEIPIEALKRTDSMIPYFLEQLGTGVYNPVNVLYVSPSLAIAASVDDTGPPRVTQLEPGLHVLTVGNIDDASREKDAVLYGYVSRVMQQMKSTSTLESSLRVVLSRHDSRSGDVLDRPCIHGDVYGTVSSSTVLYHGGELTYRHAQGRPCSTSFQLVDLIDY